MYLECLFYRNRKRKQRRYIGAFWILVVITKVKSKSQRFSSIYVSEKTIIRVLMSKLVIICIRHRLTAIFKIITPGNSFNKP